MCVQERMSVHLCACLRGDSWQAKETPLPLIAESRLHFCLKGPSLLRRALQPPILHSIAALMNNENLEAACASE